MHTNRHGMRVFTLDHPETEAAVHMFEVYHWASVLKRDTHSLQETGAKLAAFLSTGVWQ